MSRIIQTSGLLKLLMDLAHTTIVLKQYKQELIQNAFHAKKKETHHM